MGNLSITKSAANKIVELISKEPAQEKQLMLRVSVSGGGCSGFQYEFSLDNEIHKDDESFEIHGVKIIIDQTSLQLVDGSQIDYTNELIGSSFQIKNPKASSSCGCGSSFSV